MHVDQGRAARELSDLRDDVALLHFDNRREMAGEPASAPEPARVSATVRYFVDDMDEAR